MKKLAALLLALVIVFSLIACTSEVATKTTEPAETKTEEKVEEVKQEEANQEGPAETEVPETIKIGVLYPMSGSSASSGELCWMGTQMFNDYFKSQGGFENWDAEVEFVLIDTETSPEVAAAGFERLATEEDVVAVIGNFNSATSSPCVPLAIKYGMPYMIMACVNDQLLEQDNDYVFRSHVGNIDCKKTHEYFMEWLGDHMDGGMKTAAIIASADEFGANTSQTYRDVFERAGVELVLDESVQVNTSDVSGVINKLKATDPDLAVVILYTNEALLFQKGLREYKCDVPILASGAGYLEPTFIDSVGEGNADYVFANSAWIPDSLSYSPAIATELVKEAKAKYGYDFAEAVMYAWTATGTVFDAIDRAESLTPEDVAKALAETDIGFDHPANMFANLEGIKFGDIDGRYNQNIYATSFYCQIIDGEWRVIWPDEIIANNPVVWPVPSWDER